MNLSSNPVNVNQYATVTLISSTYYLITVAILHVLRPDINPIQQTTSEFAIGPYGFLMVSAFLVMGVGQGALVLGLLRGVSPSTRSRLGLVLLAVWAVGNLVAGIFPLTQTITAPTVPNVIAQINGPIHVLSLVAGAIMISSTYKEDPRWHAVHRPAQILSLVMLVEFIAVFVATATEAGVVGLGQRIFIVTVLAWIFLVAMHLRAVSMEAVRAA